MDEKRRKEIAIAIKEERERRKRICGGLDFSDADMAEMAERIGVTRDELEEYYRLMLIEGINILPDFSQLRRKERRE